MTATETTPTTQELLRRLAEGDATVTADDLVQAEDRERLALAEGIVAARLAAVAAEQERRRRIEDLVAGLPAALDGGKVERAKARMEQALGAYLAAVGERDEALSAAVAALEALAPLPPGVHVHDGYPGGVTIGPTTWRPGDPQQGISDAAVAAITAKHPRTQIRLGSS